MFRQLYTYIFALLLIGFLGSPTVFGQLDGGTPGGGIDAGALENQIFDAVEQGGGAANNTSGGTTGGSNDLTGGGGGGLNTNQSDDSFQFDDLFNFGNFGDASQGTTNERDSTFVGVTNMVTPELFPGFRHIGPLQSEISDPNSAGGFGAAGGRGSSRGGGGFGGGAGGGSQSGFEVQRPSTAVRSRILPRFSSQPVAPQFVASQVNRRFNPVVLRQSGVDANITVQGRTAVITGVAPSEQQARMLNRALRLEPGISRVRSQIQVQR